MGKNKSGKKVKETKGHVDEKLNRLTRLIIPPAINYFIRIKYLMIQQSDTVKQEMLEHYSRLLYKENGQLQINEELYELCPPKYKDVPTTLPNKLRNLSEKEMDKLIERTSQQAHKILSQSDERKSLDDLCTITVHIFKLRTLMQKTRALRNKTEWFKNRLAGAIKIDLPEETIVEEIYERTQRICFADDVKEQIPDFDISTNMKLAKMVGTRTNSRIQNDMKDSFRVVMYLLGASLNKILPVLAFAYLLFMRDPFIFLLLISAPIINAKILNVNDSTLLDIIKNDLTNNQNDIIQINYELNSAIYVKEQSMTNDQGKSQQTYTIAYNNDREPVREHLAIEDATLLMNNEVDNSMYRKVQIPEKKKTRGNEPVPINVPITPIENEEQMLQDRIKAALKNYPNPIPEENISKIPHDMIGVLDSVQLQNDGLDQNTINRYLETMKNSAGRFFLSQDSKGKSGIKTSSNIDNKAHFFNSKVQSDPNNQKAESEPKQVHSYIKITKMGRIDGILIADNIVVYNHHRKK